MTASPRSAAIRFAIDLQQGRFEDYVWKPIWEFPKIRGTFCWSPYNKDPTV